MKRMIFIAASFAMSFGLHAQDKELVVGMTAPLTGANSDYGKGLLHGVRLGLAQSAPQVALKALDDQGNAQLAADNAKQLIASGAIALTGLYGSRAAQAVRPLLAQHRVPLVGVASSADILRTPPQKEIFNLRAGAQDETDAIVYHLDTLNIEKIAAIAQDDDLGSSSLEGLKHQLTRLGMRPVALESLPPSASSQDHATAMRKICSAQPQAVLLALPATQALEVFRSAAQLGCPSSTRYAVLSETGAALSMMGTSAAGLIVSQVLPYPTQLKHPLIAEYQQALGADSKQASYPSVEGYLYGRVLGEAIRSCGRRATSACITETLENKTPKIAGWRLQFAPGDRIGSKYVDIVMLGSSGRIFR